MSAPTKPLAGVVTNLRRWAGAGGADRLPDPELLRRYVASRDEAAFACLVKRHGPMVLGVCRKLLRHEHDAEDAFQATFVVLARKARAIRRAEAVGSWLYGVAFRVANKLREAQARRRAREAPLGDDVAARGSEELTWREVERAVYAELDRLAGKYRAPLLLCYLQGKTRDEAARQLGCDLSVFRGRLERGRELLRARLLRRGLSLSAALLALGIADKAPAAVLLSAPLLSSTIKAALSAAGTTGAAGVLSTQVATLSQGVIQAMFLSKLQFVVAGLVSLAVVGSGVGLVSYRTWAQEAGATPLPAAQVPAMTQRVAGEDVDPRKLKQEVERLRRELDQLRAELLAALRENAQLRARAGAGNAPDVKVWDYMRLQKGGGAGKKAPAESKDEIFKPPQEVMAGSLDGRTLALGKGNEIWLIDNQTGKVLAKAIGHNGGVSTLHFSPDGKVLVSGGNDRSVWLWDVATMKQLRRFPGPQPVRLSFSVDGRTVTVTEDDMTERVFDLRTGQELSVSGKSKRSER
jgi:RNA polymerase sigma factor (sigma-70 family)